MSRSTVSFLIACVLMGAYLFATGTWPFDHRPSDGAPAAEPSRVQPAPADGVLYDGEWDVTEGQWWLSGAEEPGYDASYGTLLESVGRSSVYLTVPGFYGRYTTRWELERAEPEVPTWCEDVAEASMAVDGTVVMGGFEDYSTTYTVAPGTYRVRYCTEDQDAAAAEEEFDEDGESTLYPGRHLLQMWRAPRTEDAVVRTGSDFARDPGQSGGAVED